MNHVIHYVETAFMNKQCTDILVSVSVCIYYGCICVDLVWPLRHISVVLLLLFFSSVDLCKWQMAFIFPILPKLFNFTSF